MKNQSLSCVFRLVCLLLIASGLKTHAQWITQTMQLKEGWNAVFLHVDATHATLSELLDGVPGTPIDEVWLWKPATTTQQFVESPQLPTESGSQWVSWTRALGGSSMLQRLIGNTAYLVHVQTGTPSYTWNLKGKPLLPRYEWTSSGLNFLGFPTPSNAPPSFEAFLGKKAELLQNAQIFYYPGGELGAGNPLPLFALRNKTVSRGEAFWMRSGNLFNTYFGPVQVTLQRSEGIDFAETGGQQRVRLKNLINQSLKVRLTLLPSEEPPQGLPGLAPQVPVLVRGDLNPTNLTYGFSNLADGAQEWTLAPAGQPGSDKEVVLGVNRATLGGAPGDRFGGILRFQDELNLSQIDIGVSATTPNRAGLWAGDAIVDQVRHYLKNYQKDETGAVQLGTNGAPILVNINTNLGSVARPYKLRLMIHNDTAGAAPTLLARVYHGVGPATNLILTTKESLLHPEMLQSARRITAVHLPWSAENTGWALTGRLEQGFDLSGVVNTAYNDSAANPFVHTYHPDHDNLNVFFDGFEPQGAEAFLISREIKLAITPPSQDFNALTGGGSKLSGIYEESVYLYGKGGENKRFDVRGAFELNRLSDIATLTQ